MITADVQALQRAVMEATISLRAIGEPGEVIGAPNAHICGVIARSALARMEKALGKRVDLLRDGS